MKYLKHTILLISMLSLIYSGVVSYKYYNFLNNVNDLQQATFVNFQHNLNYIGETIDSIINEPENDDNYLRYNYYVGFMERSFYSYLESRMITNELSNDENSKLLYKFELLWTNIRTDLRTKSKSELEELNFQLAEITKALSEHHHKSSN